MTRRLTLRPEAAAELREAAIWYERQHAGLGLRFLDAVDGVLARVAQWPDAATRVPDMPDDLPVRRAPVATFPYHVAYIATNEAIHVLAIAHDHRRPHYWRDRAE